MIDDEFEPGPDHARLAALTGRWRVCGRILADPDGSLDDDAADLVATCEAAWILGGRFLESRYEGTCLDGVFEGRGLLGFDNHRRRFVSTWVSSTDTELAVHDGEWDEARAALVMTGLMHDPRGGGRIRTTEVTRVVDAASLRFEKRVHPREGGEIAIAEFAFDRWVDAD